MTAKSTDTPASSLRKLIAAHEFMIVGHRGAAGLAPENTLQSFEIALQWKCPMIELDVYACPNERQDQTLMVIHDNTVNRTTNGQGRVADLSVEQLRKLDAGAGQPVPLLEEVVALVTRHNDSNPLVTGLNIELKGPSTAEPTALAVAQMQTQLPVLVSSFNHDELRRFHKLAPSCPVAPLYDRSIRSWLATAQELGAIAVNLNVRSATSALIGKIKKAGFEVFVYTVNTREQAEQLRRDGATGVFTDRPDLLMPMFE